MDQLLSLLPFVAVLVIFWLFMIRPSQRRQREHQSMQAALQVGDKVMLTSGIFGTVRSLTDERARIAVAQGAEIEVVRAAIAQVETEPRPIDTDDEIDGDA